MVERYSFTRAPRLIADETHVTLEWPTTFTLTSVGAQAVSKRWVPNGAYDLDPVLGSTAMPGFAEYATFYSFYRVISYSYFLEVTNNQVFPVSAYVLNTNNDLGLTASNFELYSVAPHCQGILLSGFPSAKGYHAFKGKFEVSRILGSRAPETEDNYRSLTNALPADLVWLSLGINTNSAANLLTAVGVTMKLRLFCNTRFYGRRELAS